MLCWLVLLGFAVMELNQIVDVDGNTSVRLFLENYAKRPVK